MGATEIYGRRVGGPRNLALACAALLGCNSAPAQEPYQVSDAPPLRRAHSPMAVVDGQGHAIAVWLETGDDAFGAPASPWSSHWDAVQRSWDTPQFVGSDPALHVGGLTLLGHQNGDALLSWGQGGGQGFYCPSNRGVHTRIFSASAAQWGADEAAPLAALPEPEEAPEWGNAPEWDSALLTDVVFTPAGRVGALWSSASQETPGLATQMRSGQGWGQARYVDTAPALSPGIECPFRYGVSRLLLGEDGAEVVVASESIEPDWEWHLFSTRRQDAQSEWEPKQELWPGYAAQLVEFDAGLLALWYSHDDERWWSRRYSLASDTWSAPTPLPRPEGHGVSGLRAYAEAGGEVVAIGSHLTEVPEDGPDPREELWAIHFDVEADTWSEFELAVPERVVTDRTLAASIGREGDVALTWVSVVDGRDVLEAVRYDADASAWEEARMLVSAPHVDPPEVAPLSRAEPTVAIGDDGEALVLWTQMTQERVAAEQGYYEYPILYEFVGSEIWAMHF